MISDPPLVEPLDELVQGVERTQIDELFRELIHRYRRTLPNDRRHLLETFRFADVARRWWASAASAPEHGSC